MEHCMLYIAIDATAMRSRVMELSPSAEAYVAFGCALGFACRTLRLTPLQCVQMSYWLRSLAESHVHEFCLLPSRSLSLVMPGGPSYGRKCKKNLPSSLLGHTARRLWIVCLCQSYLGHCMLYVGTDATAICSRVMVAKTLV